MSKGTYCSASQRMDSASSSEDMAGSEIFLMMTEWPDREVAKSLLRTFKDEITRLTVSTTREASMSSTSLTAEEPMSRPTRFLDFLNSTLTPPKEFKRFRAWTTGYVGCPPR